MDAFDNKSEDQDVVVTKEAWVTPEISRINAGAAELGPNPFAPEGSFGDAS